MQIHLTAAGTPAEIMATLARDAARERSANPEYAGAIAGLRDDIAKQVGAGETLKGDEAATHYTVSAKIEITVDAQANATDAELARKALVGGQPFTPSAAGKDVPNRLAEANQAEDESSRAARRRASDQARIDAANAGTTK